MATRGEKYRQLAAFFSDSFSPRELEIFLWTRVSQDVTRAVSAADAPAVYFFKIVKALDRRGLIDLALFANFTETLPRKAAQIAKLRDLWLDEDGRATDASGIREFDKPDTAEVPRSARSRRRSSAVRRASGSRAETGDLWINLKAMPRECGPDNFASFELQSWSRDEGLLRRSGSLPDPLVLVAERELFWSFQKGEPDRHSCSGVDVREQLRWYLEDYWRWPYPPYSERGQETENLLIEFGKGLYRTLFGPVPQPRRWDRILISSESPVLQALPWELLHDEQGFLVFSHPPISIVRTLPRAQDPLWVEPIKPPLRILLVTSRPTGKRLVDPRNIGRELLHALVPVIRSGEVALEFLRPPTLEKLRQRLSFGPPVHVVHFDGQASFSAEDGGEPRGKLEFEDEFGALRNVSADEFATALQCGCVRAAVLTAGQTAVGSTTEIFSSVAARLVRGGLDAVAAMSSSIMVDTGVVYSAGLYASLREQSRWRSPRRDPGRRCSSTRREASTAGPLTSLRWSSGLATGGSLGSISSGSSRSKR